MRPIGEKERCYHSGLIYPYCNVQYVNHRIMKGHDFVRYEDRAFDLTEDGHKIGRILVEYKKKDGDK